MAKVGVPDPTLLLYLPNFKKGEEPAGRGKKGKKGGRVGHGETANKEREMLDDPTKISSSRLFSFTLAITREGKGEKGGRKGEKKKGKDRKLVRKGGKKKARTKLAPGGYLRSFFYSNRLAGGEEKERKGKEKRRREKKEEAYVRGLSTKKKKEKERRKERSRACRIVRVNHPHRWRNRHRARKKKKGEEKR